MGVLATAFEWRQFQSGGRVIDHHIKLDFPKDKLPQLGEKEHEQILDFTVALGRTGKKEKWKFPLRISKPGQHLRI